MTEGRKVEEQKQTRAGSINALLNSQFQHLMQGVHFSMINSTLLCVGVYSCPKFSEMSSSSFRKNYVSVSWQVTVQGEALYEQILVSPVVMYDSGNSPS